MIEEQTAEEVVYWITRHIEESRRAPNRWLGMATRLVSKAFENPTKPRLEWARPALMIYEYLADGDDHGSITIKAMLLRVRLMKACGIDPTEPLLDPEAVIGWLRRNLPLDYEPVQQDAETFRRNPQIMQVDTVLRLRQLKQKLHLVEHLATENSVDLDPSMARWFALLPLLP